MIAADYLGASLLIIHQNNYVDICFPITFYIKDEFGDLKQPLALKKLFIIVEFSG
jgi:hypothetical protein